MKYGVDEVSTSVVQRKGVQIGLQFVPLFMQLFVVDATNYIGVEICLHK